MILKKFNLSYFSVLILSFFTFFLSVKIIIVSVELAKEEIQFGIESLQFIRDSTIASSFYTRLENLKSQNFSLKDIIPYEKEFETYALQSKNLIDFENTKKNNGIIENLAIAIKNNLDSLFEPGSSLISSKQRGTVYLELSYTAIRFRKYKEALALLSTAEKYYPRQSPEKAFIIFSKIYCSFFVGQFENFLVWKNDYLENGNFYLKNAFERLILFAEKEAKVINSTNRHMLNDAELISFYFEHLQFYSLLSKFNSLSENDKSSLKLQYIQARTFEETGQFSEAISLYQKIITNNIKNSIWKRSANRRIYILAATYLRSPELLESSAKLAEGFGDSFLLSLHKKYSKSIDRVNSKDWIYTTLLNDEHFVNQIEDNFGKNIKDVFFYELNDLQKFSSEASKALDFAFKEIMQKNLSNVKKAQHLIVELYMRSGHYFKGNLLRETTNSITIDAGELGKLNINKSEIAYKKVLPQI